jgi:serine phosphatase RsbU (regulator of sigma subunit)
MNSVRDMYGVDRLKDYLVANREQSAQALLRGLQTDLDTHAQGEEAEDDVTMIAIKID